MVTTNEIKLGEGDQDIKAAGATHQETSHAFIVY
jgi:hypothetical protein